MTSAELRTKRREMAQRRRRIIFNNDGDDLGADGAHTPEGLLEVRTTALLDSHVDAIFYYSSHGMKLLYRDGPFGRLYRITPRQGGPFVQFAENYRRLVGTYDRDALEVMVETCHAYGKEVFYSNRMNDCHDSFFPWHIYDIKLRHPEYILSTKEEVERHGYKFPDVRSYWSALNFELPEVRGLVVEALGEVCRSYDIDGIELDFLRAPVYFPPTIEGKPVDGRHIELMSELMRRIRSTTEEEGLRRGRPILLAARCPSDLELSLSVGLDVETWLREGLIDILIVGRFVQFTMPVKPLIDLAHRYDVPAYPMVANCGYKNRGGGLQPSGAPFLPNSADPLMYRGDAMVLFSEGADGVYTFNFFEPGLSLWWELGDPEKLAGMNKDYVWDYLPSHRGKGDLLWELRLSERRPPLKVTALGCEPIPLMVGEDLASPPPEGRRRLLCLRVYMSDLTPEHRLSFRLNGQALPDALDRRGGWLELHPPAELFRVGENLLQAVLETPAGEEPEIDEVRLEVRYPPAGSN